MNDAGEKTPLRTGTAKMCNNAPLHGEAAVIDKSTPKRSDVATESDMPPPLPPKRQKLSCLTGMRGVITPIMSL